MEVTKTCTKCKEEKTLDSFHNRPNHGYKFGVAAICKACTKIYATARRQSEEGKIVAKNYNREKRKETRKKYLSENGDKVREAARIYREKNRDNILKTAREYKANNIDSIKKLRFEYNQRQTLELSDGYIAYLLSGKNADIRPFITQELIELKRIHLKTKRLCLQLKN
jgi:hypothetical protein